jgi:hypothetical protein
VLYDNSPLAIERQANAAKALSSLAGILVTCVRQVPATLSQGFTSLLDALDTLGEHWVFG